MERVSWKLTTPYVKQIVSGNFLFNTQEIKEGLCDNLEVWKGEGDGREVWEGGDMGLPMADSC